MNTLTALQRRTLDWRARLELVVATMREMSRQTDPLEMGRAYASRMAQMLDVDGFVSVSRRELDWPFYRVTRSSRWTEAVNPWRDRHKLPLMSGGLLAELLYGDEPRLLTGVSVGPDDPAFEYLDGMSSLMAIPHYDQGVGLNMVVALRRHPGAFEEENFPEQVWVSGLFGRATHNLVLASQLQDALGSIDRELQTVGDIQRSLLPARLPDVPGLALAAHYQTSRKAGGDYYDFFPLPDGRLGVLIADVSGHGTPAAVLMAVTHSLAHAFAEPPEPAGKLLRHLNHHLCERYTGETGTFVTAFYGVYDPAGRTLTYSSAGHPPPLLKHCDDGTMSALNGARGLPLGIHPGEAFREAEVRLRRGDQLVFYTDGVTEAESPDGRMFGTDQLDRVLGNCAVGAADLLREVLSAVEEFTAGQPATDDRTLLVAKVT